MKLRNTFRNQSLFIPAVIAIFLFDLSVAFAMTNKSVYGYLEPVTLYPDKIPMIAKLDTGAETASLSAKNIRLYKKEGKEFVKFKIDHPEIEQARNFNLPLVRQAKIKKRTGENLQSNPYQERPVVKMKIAFDGKPYKINVNLIDRSHFSTPLLLGRKALKKMDAVVDSTTKNTLIEETNK